MNGIARTLSALLLPGLFAWAAIAGSPALAQPATQGARADLKDAKGNVVGMAIFSPDATGVKLQVQVQGFTGAAEGQHGIHVHAVGKCEGDAFTTAGGHFNPEGKKHGLNNPEGAHAGDMPNIVFDAKGSASYETILGNISLGGEANSMLDADGSALVIHAGQDDLVTDPSGNSGARIACGVMSAYEIPVAGMPRTGGVGERLDAGLIFWTLLFAGLLLLVSGSYVSARARR